MARLRVFVSSTYYDLKHVRSALELTIEGMGHEAILFERGNVVFDPSKPLDESCYGEMDTADVVVLIIGGRYGSEVSETRENNATIESAFREFDSITRKEHSTALAKGVPVYTFIEKAVQAEYRTYLKNKGNTSIHYAHVDSTNVFSFIESIESLGSNNVIQGFERASDIETWLKEQWSGLFRELLKRRSEAAEVSTLSAEVERLREAGKTLEKYLEEVLRKVQPDKAEAIINDEAKRRVELLMEELTGLQGPMRLSRASGVSPGDLMVLLSESSSFEEFLHSITAHPNFVQSENFHKDGFLTSTGHRRDFDHAKELIDMLSFYFAQRKDFIALLKGLQKNRPTTPLKDLKSKYGVSSARDTK